MTVNSPVARTEVCPNCDADVRVCKNCKQYDVGSQYDCREHICEVVRDKERANFCDWFSFENKELSTDTTIQNKVNDAKNQFAALFGD